MGPPGRGASGLPRSAKTRSGAIRGATCGPGGPAGRHIVDTETTGMDLEADQVIELGMIAFDYDDSGAVGPVVGSYSAFEDPGRDIPVSSTAIHHITDEMVAGQRIDDAAVASLLDGVTITVAHNAGFDRRFLERRLSVFEDLPWASSFYEVPWAEHDLSSAKLEYLAYRAGFFYEGHRAENDCRALLEVLRQPLGTTGVTA
ncbi:MAG: 3'-5' exonuclease [Reyranella sp.]